MKQFYSTLLLVILTYTLHAQTFEFSIQFVGTNTATSNYQMALIAAPTSSVSNGTTADMGAGFYVPSGVTIGNFVSGDSGIPSGDWSSSFLGSNGNGDAYFLGRTESGSSSIILNGTGPFQLVLFDVIADPNPSSGTITFVENGDPVFDSLFVQNYMNVNLGTGTTDAYVQNDPLADSVEFSTLSITESGSRAINNFKVYPNPTDSVAMLSMKEVYNQVEVCVLNTIGQAVFSNSFKNTKDITINLQNHPSGIYFVEAKIQHEKYRIKLIKR